MSRYSEVRAIAGNACTFDAVEMKACLAGNRGGSANNYVPLHGLTMELVRVSRIIDEFVKRYNSPFFGERLEELATTPAGLGLLKKFPTCYFVKVISNYRCKPFGNQHSAGRNRSLLSRIMVS